ncbi:hypothetical protein ACRAVF_14685 [Bradyrhizobium oligotrophicum S58]
MRLSVFGLVMLCCGPLAHADESPPLERGAAILEPFALRELDNGAFGLGKMLAHASDAPLTDAALFALPSMMPVRKALDAEFDRYVDKHRTTLPNESIGVGTSYAFQLFDRTVLDSSDARFVLAGVVNRMDRAFVDPDHCGEVRLLYRLTRTTPPEAKDGEVASPRLPMTLNIVLKARSDAQAKSNSPSCAEIAKRWLATSDLQLTGPELAAKLTAPDGPLALIRPENIHRIETNLQIAHAPKSAIRDFRTDYMMKVFDYQATSGTFEEAVLEDQVDRDRLLADAALAREFKAWLLDPVHLGELDRGTAVIPEQFLAKVAVAPTPVGFVNSDLLPAYGLVQGARPGRAGGVHRGRRSRCAGKGGRAGHRAAEHPVGRGFRAPPQRFELRRLPSDPRHRRLSLPRRRLDGGEAVQHRGGAWFAAFLRRPGPPARHPHRLCRGPRAGLLTRLRQPSAIARQR